MMDITRTLSIVGAVLALALAAWVGRYEIEPASTSVEFVYRMDRWTGQVEVVDMDEELDRLDAHRAQGRRP